MILHTAGESHGGELVGIIENVPSGLRIDEPKIKKMLDNRRLAAFRSNRQSIESDTFSILAGVVGGVTIGSPVCFSIKNAEDRLSGYLPENARTAVRPGHAEYVGAVKYGLKDAALVSERASARSTAVDVAAGAIAIQMLELLGVKLCAFTRALAGVFDESDCLFESLPDANNRLGFISSRKADEAQAAMAEYIACGETAGGIVELRVKGMKSGFGSCMESRKKLDARLSAALMAIPAVKGVSFGLGFGFYGGKGSQVNDALYSEKGRICRNTNFNGGFEGGMTTGEEIVVSLALKPIPTTRAPLPTVDLITKEAANSVYVRSDDTAVTAVRYIAECVCALELTQAVSERLGGDSIEEIIDRWNKLP